MLYAEIRGAGEIISAEKASRYGNYRCPTCRAEVFLRAGRIYEHHFAHVPGQGKPQCEDYHPPEHLRRQWEKPSPQSSPHKIDGLLLSIELEPDRERGRGPRGWGLRLTVPKSYDSHGQITMDLGGGDLRRVSLTTLYLAAQTYRAHPEARDFGASWVSHEVRAEYRQAIEHRIAGLTPSGVTAFGAVPQKFKPRCSTLRWGESYYFVWRRDRSIELPSSLPHYGLADSSGWSCCLLSLPDTSISDVEIWLEQNCGVQVASARREWALIYPPPYGLDGDGNVNIHSAAPLLLAIKPVADACTIRCIAGPQAESLKLSGAQRHVVEIGVEHQIQQRPIHLALDEMPLNSIVARPHTESAKGPDVLVEFDHRPHKTRIPLHRLSCHAELMRVRTADQEILGVHADTRLRGSLLFRRAGQFDWQSEQLGSSQSDTRSTTDALPTIQVDRLNEVLKDRSLDVVVDFGAYGVFHANASIRSERPHVQISRRLRVQIEWLCKAASAFVDGQRRPIHTIDDAALLRHLDNVKTPVWLLANRRAVERDLRRIERGLPA